MRVEVSINSENDRNVIDAQLVGSLNILTSNDVEHHLNAYPMYRDAFRTTLLLAKTTAKREVVGAYAEHAREFIYEMNKLDDLYNKRTRQADAVENLQRDLHNAYENFFGSIMG